MLSSYLHFCQSWARVIFLMTQHASPHHVVLSTCHTSPVIVVFFQHFSLRHCHFASRIRSHITLTPLLNPCWPISYSPPLLAVKLTPSAQRSSSTTSGGQIHPSPPSSHPPPLLAVKFILPRPAVILHPFWWLNSPLSAQQSSSTTSGGQIHPSPPSGHSPPLLVVKFTSQHPAVILHTIWQLNSPPPCPTVILKPCWRSYSTLCPAVTSSTPAGGQPHPSPAGGHLPPLLLADNFTPSPARN